MSDEPDTWGAWVRRHVNPLGLTCCIVAILLALSALAETIIKAFRQP